MAAIAPITLPDGKATPESHVFAPKASLPTALYARDNVAGQSKVAWEKLSVKVGSSKNDINNVAIELTIPVMEQPAGGTSSGYTAAPKVAHTMTGQIKFFMHDRTTAADRKDLRVMLMEALKNSAIIDAVEKLEQPY